jgi:hypothetical protein
MEAVRGQKHFGTQCSVDPEIVMNVDPISQIVEQDRRSWFLV